MTAKDGCDDEKRRTRTRVSELQAAGIGVATKPFSLSVMGGASCVLFACANEKVARGYENVRATLYGKIDSDGSTPTEVILCQQDLPPGLSWLPAREGNRELVLRWSGPPVDGFRVELAIRSGAGQTCTRTAWTLRSYADEAPEKPSAGFTRWTTGTGVIVNGGASVVLLQPDPARRRALITAPTGAAVFIVDTNAAASGVGLPFVGPAILELRHTEGIYVSTTGAPGSTPVSWSVERQ